MHREDDGIWHELVELPLPNDVAEIGEVRHTARRALAGHPGLDMAEVVISELTGNALVHGDAPSTLRIYERNVCLLIEVEDRSDTEPVVGPPLENNFGETGRGLQLVLALSSEFGVDPVVPRGKVVWATLCEP